MAARVPVARRNLMAEPRRLIAATTAVGLALMLILLLAGLWSGIDASVTVYEDHSGADLYVAQPGTRNFFGAISVLAASEVDRVRADPDVQWAAPVRAVFSILQMHDTKVPAFLIGWIPGQRGGPWSIEDGSTVEHDDEVVVGRTLAQRHGVRVGDRVEVLGRSFEVVGVAGADMFMAPFVFMTHAATDALLLAPDTTSFLLVGTANPEAVRARLSSSGLAVLDRDELEANDLAVMSRPFSLPLRVMVSVAFAVGSLVIALTAYSAVFERRREYGIIKALGAGRLRLYRLAVSQTLILACLGLVAGGVLFLGGRWFIGWARPQFAIVLTPTTVGRAVALAFAMGVVAAVLPARRLTRLDPAVAFRGT